MADNIKELKFKVSGDTTELVDSWEKAKTSLNDLSAVLNAKAKAINGLSEIQQRNFDRLQELAKAEQELIRRTGLATLELGKIKEKVSKQVENGVLSEAEAYKRLQKDASTYYKFVEDQERKVRALSPTTVGATSTAGGSDRSRPVKSDPNTYFDFAKNKLVNIKDEEEKLLKQRETFTKEFQERQIQRNKEFLDQQLHDEQSNINSRRVAQANLFTELLDKEEAQKKASILAAQTKQQQELAATKIQEENLRKQFASFQRNLSQEEAALKHSLQVQLQEHLTGIHSVEVARLNSIEKIRQLEERRSRLINVNSSRVQTGIISPQAGTTRQQTINNAFVPAIHAANVELAEQNRLITENTEKHKTLHLAVRNIIASYAVFVSLQNTVVAGLQKFIDVGVQLESVRASLTATLGTLDNPENFAKTGNMLAALDAEAERTGIHIGTLRSTFSGLQASMSLAGESLATTNKVFGNLDTVITALHLPAEKAQGIFNALAQIFNKSKVQSEELVKQLGNLIPGAFASFAAANKTSTQQLAKDMKNGLVFAHDTVANFTDFLATRFSAAFEIANQGLNSQIGRMQTSFTHLSETIYGLSSGALVSGVKGLTSFANFLNEVVKGETLAAKNTQTLVNVIEAGLLVATFNAARGMLALKLGVEGLGIAAGATILKANAMKASLAFLTAPGTILAGLIAIGLQLKGFHDDADAAEEGLKKVHEKWQLLLGTGNKITKETQFKFDIENDQGVKEQRQYLAGVLQKLENIQKDHGERNFIRAKEIAEKKKLIAEGELDLAREIKRASDELKQKELENDGTRLEAKEKWLTDAKQIELSFRKDEKSAREKALSDYMEENKAKIEGLKKVQNELVKDSIPFAGASKVGISEEDIAKYREATTAINQLQAGAISVQEKASETFRQKELQAADTSTSRQIELTKKLYAQQEREQKLSHDRRLQEMDQFLQILELKQANPDTAIGQSNFINAQLELNKQKLSQLDLEFESRKRISQELEKQVSLDALQVSNIATASEGFKKIAPIIDRLETGGLQNPYRAVSRTAAIGKHQFEPSTLQDLANKGQINLQVPSFALELEKKGRSGQTLSTSEKEALADWAESIKSTLDQAFVSFVEGNIKYFKGDLLKAVIAHNAGPGGVDRAVSKNPNNFINSLPEEARNYAIKSGLTSGEISKSETKAIIQTPTSENDQAELELQLQREKFAIELDSKKLNQDLELIHKQVENEIRQQLILQKQSSGELVEAARLQDIIDNGDKRILLSKEEQDSTLAEQNKRLLALTNAARDRNIEEAKLTEILNKQSIAYTNLQFELDKISNRVQTGNETPFGAIVESQAKAAEAAKIKEANMPSIIAGINKLRDTGTIAPLQANQQIIEEQRGLLNLQTQAQEVENYFRTNLASAFEAPFKNIIEGKTNAIGALKEFGVAILSLLEELIVKELALAAAKAAVSAVSSSIGFFSQGGSVSEHSGVSYGMFSQALATGGQVLNFPSGGLVKGPGTETSDSIKALVAPGSYVIKASSVPAFDKAKQQLIHVSKNEKILPPNIVQMFGKDRLDKINTNGSYAEGGLVGKEVLPSNLGLASSSAMSYTNNYHISVNVPEGKGSREEAKQTGNEIAVAMMQKIARIESSKQISIYDKTHKLRKG